MTPLSRLRSVRPTPESSRGPIRRRACRSTIRLVLGALAALSPLLVAAGPARAEEGAPRLRILTEAGSFTVELYPRRAPGVVARFLELAGSAEGGKAAYRGSRVCESRARGFLIFGCPPPGGAAPRGPWPDEIDAAALGLEGRRLDDTAERQLLWQREILPRYVRLRQTGRPVPAGLEALVAALRERGTEATSLLEGRSRRWYLEALGFRYRAGTSDLPVTRGALASPNLWPGEADGRFLVALADLPERDGRGTVFGRVIEGLEVLDALAARPVDKSHRPLEPLSILDLRPAEPGAPETAPGGSGGKDATP